MLKRVNWLKDHFCPDMQLFPNLLDTTFASLMDFFVTDIKNENSMLISNKIDIVQLLSAATTAGIKTDYQMGDFFEADVCVLAQGDFEKYQLALSKIARHSNKQYLLARIRKFRLMHLLQSCDQLNITESQFVEAKTLAEQIADSKVDMQDQRWLGDVYGLWIDWLLKQNNAKKWDEAMVKAEEACNKKINSHQDLLRYTLKTVVYKLVELQVNQTTFTINLFKKTLDIAAKSESVELFEYVCHISMQMVQRSPALLQSVCSLFTGKVRELLKSKRKDINYCRMFYNLALLVARLNVSGFEDFKSDATSALLVRLMVMKNYDQAVDAALMAENMGIPGKLNFVYNQQINLMLQDTSEPDATLAKVLECIALIKQKQPKFDISELLAACTKYMNLNGSESFQQATIAKISELKPKPLVSEQQALPSIVSSTQLVQMQLSETQSSHSNYYLLTEIWQDRTASIPGAAQLPQTPHASNAASSNPNRQSETNMTNAELERVLNQLPDVPTASKVLAPA